MSQGARSVFVPDAVGADGQRFLQVPLPISDIVFLSSTGVLGAGTIAFLKITDRKTEDFLLEVAVACYDDKALLF